MSTYNIGDVWLYKRNSKRVIAILVCLPTQAGEKAKFKVLSSSMDKWRNKHVFFRLNRVGGIYSPYWKKIT